MSHQRISLSHVVLFLSLGLLLAYRVRGQELTPDPGEPATRSFRLTYAVELSGIPEDGDIRVWLPIPPSNIAQDVQLLDVDIPAKYEVTREPVYGNEMLTFHFVEPPASKVSFVMTYHVVRREVRAFVDRQPYAERLALNSEKFLLPNKNVPIVGIPTELIQDLPKRSDTVAAARLLYDLVDDYVRYDKSQPGYGRGDVLWVCDSRFGNCTDFHSLFISLARAQGLPARFEMGFPLPPKHGNGTVNGYHCWASFYVKENGWIPVDISEADKHPELKEYYFGNLTEDRVTFTIGRDIELVPRQTGPPLNYFIYPYVEVGGTALSSEQIHLQVSYDDENL